MPTVWRMGERTDGRTNGRTDRRTDGQKDRKPERQTLFRLVQSSSSTYMYINSQRDQQYTCL